MSEQDDMFALAAKRDCKSLIRFLLSDQKITRLDRLRHAEVLNANLQAKNKGRKKAEFSELTPVARAIKDAAAEVVQEVYFVKCCRTLEKGRPIARLPRGERAQIIKKTVSKMRAQFPKIDDLVLEASVALELKRSPGKRITRSRRLRSRLDMATILELNQVKARESGSESAPRRGRQRAF